MTDHVAESRSGIALFVAALTSIAACLFALTYVLSLLFLRTNPEVVRELGVIAVTALFVTAPIAIGTSLMIRCRACDRLLLPLVYDGKSLFTAKSPTAFAIMRTAVSIVIRRRAPCPHCKVEAQV